MGTLSKLYSNFSNATAKHAVAREFGLNHHKFLRSWLECLAVLRNCCAHHSRLSNHVFPVKTKMPERMPNTWIADFSFREQTLYLIVMDSGHIVEQGSHDELMAKNGFYADLYNSQFAVT